MAKNTSNPTDELLERLETLSDKLEKTNSNLAARISEIIRSQASVNTTQTEFREQLGANQQEITTLNKTVSELKRTIEQQKQTIERLKETVNTNTNTLPAGINSVSQTIGVLLTNQQTIDNKYNQNAEQTNKHIDEDRLDKRMYIAIIAILAMGFLALLYKYHTLEQQVDVISSQLETIYSAVKGDKDIDGKAEPSSTATPNDKTKSNSKK